MLDAVSAGITAADLDTTADVGALVQQTARRNRAELQEALFEAKEPRRALASALEKARSRILRLTVLLESNRDTAAADADREAAIRCRQEERHMALILQCGSQMSWLRHVAVDALATRQPDIDGAAKQLADSSANKLGGAAPHTDATALALAIAPPGPRSDDGTEALALRREMLARLSTSQCLDDGARPSHEHGDVVFQSNSEARGLPATARMKVEIRANGLRIERPGAFVVRATLTSKTWQVLEATPIVGRSYGVVTRRADEESLALRLQAAADAENQGYQGDPLAAICRVAHTYSTNLWLRVLHGEAYNIARERREEIASVWWDKRGFLLIRLGPLLGILESSAKTESAAGTASGGAIASEDLNAGLSLGTEDDPLKKRGCIAEFRPDVISGGIVVGTVPDLGVGRAWMPLELEEGGSFFLEELLASFRREIALRKLRNAAENLRQPESLARLALSPEDVEIQEEGPLLQVKVRGCDLYVHMENAGRIRVSADGWAELLDRPDDTDEGRLIGTANAMAGRTMLSQYGDETNLVGRLEAGRMHAIRAAISRSASATGWTPNTSLATASEGRSAFPPMLFGFSGENKEPSAADCTSADAHACLAKASMLLSLDVRDAEVLPSVDLVPALSSLQTVHIQTTGLSPLQFNGIADLRPQLPKFFSTAQALAESMFVHVLENVISQFSGDSRYTVTASVSNGWTGCAVEWQDCGEAGDEPSGRLAINRLHFVSPLRFAVSLESGNQLEIGLTLKEPTPLVGANTPLVGATPTVRNADGFIVATLRSGGRLVATSTSNPKGQVFKRLRWASNVVLRYDISEKAQWTAWPQDLKDLSILLEFARQAVRLEITNAGDTSKRDGAGVKRTSEDLKCVTGCCLDWKACVPGRLRWILSVEGEHSKRRLEFGQAPEDAGRADAKGTPVPVALGVSCSFRWLDDPLAEVEVTADNIGPSLLLETQSKHACETRDLGAALDAVVATVELVRAVEGVARLQANWSIHAIGPRCVQVAWKRCVAVELKAVARGRVSCSSAHQPDSRRLQAGTRLLAVPSLAGFVAHSLGGSEAVAGSKVLTFDFVSGTLAKRLAPLWDYLHMIGVLHNVYRVTLSELSKDPAAGGMTKLVMRSRKPEAASLMCWASMEWDAPVFGGARCHIGICTRRLGEALVKPGAAPKRRRVHGDMLAEHSVECFMRFEILDATGMSDQMQNVLRGLSPYIEMRLAGPNVRASQVLRVLELLRAPYLWMVEDVASLICLAAERPGQLAVDSVALAPQKSGDARTWRLTVGLGSVRPRRIVALATESRRDQGGAGWNDLTVDGVSVLAWVKQRRASHRAAATAARACADGALMLGRVREALLEP